MAGSTVGMLVQWPVNLSWRSRIVTWPVFAHCGHRWFAYDFRFSRLCFGLDGYFCECNRNIFSASFIVADGRDLKTFPDISGLFRTCRAISWLFRGFPYFSYDFRIFPINLFYFWKILKLFQTFQNSSQLWGRFPDFFGDFRKFPIVKIYFWKIWKFSRQFQDFPWKWGFCK